MGAGSEGEINDKGAKETFGGGGKIIVCGCYRTVFIDNFPRIVHLHLMNLTVYKLHLNKSDPPQKYSSDKTQKEKLVLI